MNLKVGKFIPIFSLLWQVGSLRKSHTSVGVPQKKHFPFFSFPPSLHLLIHSVPFFDVFIKKPPFPTFLYSRWEKVSQEEEEEDPDREIPQEKNSWGGKLLPARQSGKRKCRPLEELFEFPTSEKGQASQSKQKGNRQKKEGERKCIKNYRILRNPESKHGLNRDLGGLRGLLLVSPRRQQGLLRLWFVAAARGGAGGRIGGQVRKRNDF